MYKCISHKCISQRTLLHLCACALVFLFAAGCESSDRLTPAEQIRALRQEKRQLQNQLEQSRSQNQQLKKQVQVISGLPEDKFESLYELKKIKLTRYTNLYDKDKDGKKEKLIVYIQPIDTENDKVKAGGTVDVQLWDLNRESDKALLGQWHVGPDELKKLWFDTFLFINYRLAFDVADIVESFDEPLTVKVTFTDYLSGKVLTEQKVLKP
jgi:seryl-tRNA synthetase